MFTLIAEAHSETGKYDSDMWNHMFSITNFSYMGIMIIFWVLIVIGAVYLAQHISAQNNNKGSKTPLEILKSRYARGEIDKKEFESKKKDLSS